LQRRVLGQTRRALRLQRQDQWVVKDWIGFHPSESARISNVVPKIINILQNSLQNLWIFHESQGVNSYQQEAHSGRVPRPGLPGCAQYPGYPDPADRPASHSQTPNLPPGDPCHPIPAAGLRPAPTQRLVASSTTRPSSAMHWGRAIPFNPRKNSGCGFPVCRKALSWPADHKRSAGHDKGWIVLAWAAKHRVKCAERSGGRSSYCAVFRASAPESWNRP